MIELTHVTTLGTFTISFEYALFGVLLLVELLFHDKLLKFKDGLLEFIS